MSERRSASNLTEAPTAKPRRVLRAGGAIAGITLLAACTATVRVDSAPSETTATPSASTPNNAPTITPVVPTTETTPYGKRKKRFEGKYCTDSPADHNTPLKVENNVQPNTFTIEGGCAGDPNFKSSVYLPRAHPERMEGGDGQEVATFEDGTPFAVGCLLRGARLQSNAEASSDLWARGILPNNPAIGVVDIPVHLLGAPRDSFPIMIQDKTVTLQILDAPAPEKDCGPLTMPTYYPLPSN